MHETLDYQTTAKVIASNHRSRVRLKFRAPCRKRNRTQDASVTLRYASKLRHLGIGSAHRGKRGLLLIAGDHVTTSDAATGEILTEHILDASKNYQAPPGANLPSEPTKNPGHDKSRRKYILRLLSSMSRLIRQR